MVASGAWHGNSKRWRDLASRFRRAILGQKICVKGLAQIGILDEQLRWLSIRSWKLICRAHRTGRSDDHLGP